MRFALAITTLIAAVTAAPSGHHGEKDLHKMTLGQAGDRCGADQSIYCCNEKTTKIEHSSPETGLGGLLGATIGADGLLSHLLGTCTKIPVNVLAIGNLLQSECTNRAACCHNTPSVAYGGLVNLALPCVAIGSLIQ
ncbi:class I hydrophobin [Beauveria brongniartii RCEF 3172]|uniref:Hydrophobin n=1 Tax=Beauveria brongniartii RCEF 3172 TaxID=1081107 RepID=A0A167L9V1_9HYPO|nr:class I hydrophobin [Beauveria brongniartii RCEF 3172]